jgi:hypothetical protein
LKDGSKKSIAVNVFKQALYGDAFLKNFLFCG